METTQGVPRRDLIDGLGSAVVGFLIMLVVTLYSGLGSLGPTGFVVLVAVGVLATVGTYVFVTPENRSAEDRVPWVSVINIGGSAVIGYIALVFVDSFLSLSLASSVSTAVSFVVGFVVAGASYLSVRRL